MWKLMAGSRYTLLEHVRHELQVVADRLKSMEHTVWNIAVAQVQTFAR